MDEFYDREQDPIIPQILREDITQEQAILYLEGIERPSQIIIRHRLQRGHSEYLISEFSQEAIPISMSEVSPEVTPGLFEKLIEWAFSFDDPELHTMIQDFMEEGTDLKELLVYLKSNQYLRSSRVPEAQAKKVSLAEMIRELFQNNPDTVFTKREILEYTREVHSSKRPEAAGRQVLRQLVERGFIKEVEDAQFKYNR